MATLQPAAIHPASPDRGLRIEGPSGWKRRLDDPFNTYYRYPLALAITRLLVRTPLTPNQVSLVQPFFAAAAGYLITFDGLAAHLAAVALFELRSVLDCVDGTLARAKKLSSPSGHAIDAAADWLGVVFFYFGIHHYLYHHTPSGWPAWTATLVVCLALAQAAIRSAAFDYFKGKFIGIYERATDDVPHILRDKVLGLGDKPSIFARIDVGIRRTELLLFELKRPSRCRPLPPCAIEKMIRDQETAPVRIMSLIWSISGGDAFLSLVILSIVADQIWTGQIFFATVGFAWIVGVIALNVAFFRRYRRASSDEAVAAAG